MTHPTLANVTRVKWLELPSNLPSNFDGCSVTEPLWQCSVDTLTSVTLFGIRTQIAGFIQKAAPEWSQNECLKLCYNFRPLTGKLMGSWSLGTMEKSGWPRFRWKAKPFAKLKSIILASTWLQSPESTLRMLGKRRTFMVNCFASTQFCELDSLRTSGFHARAFVVYNSGVQIWTRISNALICSNS